MGFLPDTFNNWLAVGQGTVTPPTPKPTITGFLPLSGARGSTVVVTGTNLLGATLVSINSGAVASFAVDSATQITAVLSNAQATGKLRVTTPSGTATSAADFTVITGPVPSPVFTPTKENYFYDALGGDNLGDGYVFSSFASEVQVRTSGTKLKINQFSTNDDNSFLAIWDGTTYIEVPRPTAYNTSEPRSITLPGSGSRIIRIVTGSQQTNRQALGIDRRGTWLQNVQVLDDATATLLTPPASYDAAFYIFGDSKTVGIGTTSPQRDGIVPLLRGLLPGNSSVVSDGYGYRSMTGTVINQDSINQFVSRFVYGTRNAPRKVLYCEPFINDYRDGNGLANITGLLLPNLFSAVRAAVPSVEIFLETPLLYNEGVLNTAATPYTPADMRVALTNYVAADGRITLTQGPLMLPANQDLHPNDAGNAIWASNIKQAFSPIDYNATPEGDSSSVRVALNGISQKITAKKTASDLTNGFSAIIQVQTGKDLAAYRHMYSAGDYGTRCCFRLFTVGGPGAKIAFTNLSGPDVELDIPTLPAPGGYIAIGLYASPAGTGFVTSLGTSGTGPGVSPIDFTDFTIGALKVGEDYPANYLSDSTPGNVSFFAPMLASSDLKARTNNQGLLTKAQYSAPECLLFSSLKESKLGDNTMLNLAKPANIITLQ